MSLCREKGYGNPFIIDYSDDEESLHSVLEQGYSASSYDKDEFYCVPPNNVLMMIPSKCFENSDNSNEDVEKFYKQLETALDAHESENENAGQEGEFDVATPNSTNDLLVDNVLQHHPELIPQIVEEEIVGDIIVDEDLVELDMQNPFGSVGQCLLSEVVEVKVEKTSQCEVLPTTNPDDLLRYYSPDEDSLSISEKVSLMLNPPHKNEKTDWNSIPPMGDSLDPVAINGPCNPVDVKLNGTGNAKDFKPNLENSAKNFKTNLENSPKDFKPYLKNSAKSVGLPTGSVVLAVVNESGALIPVEINEADVTQFGAIPKVVNPLLSSAPQRSLQSTKIVGQNLEPAAVSPEVAKNPSTDKTAVLEANDPESLLKVFEETNFQPPSAPMSESEAFKVLNSSAPSETKVRPTMSVVCSKEKQTTNSRIIDSLPMEVIEKIKASSQKRSIKILTDDDEIPSPNKKRGRKPFKCKNLPQINRKNKNAVLPQPKDGLVLKVPADSKASVDSDDIDHDYCISPEKPEPKIDTFNKIPDYYASLSPNSKKSQPSPDEELPRKDSGIESGSVSDASGEADNRRDPMSNASQLPFNEDSTLYSKLPDYITSVSNACTDAVEPKSEPTAEGASNGQQREPRTKRKLKISEYRIRLKTIKKSPPIPVPQSDDWTPKGEINNPIVKKEHGTPTKASTQPPPTPDSPEVKIIAVKDARSKKVEVVDLEDQNDEKLKIGEAMLSRMPSTSLGHSLIYSKRHSEMSPKIKSEARVPSSSQSSSSSTSATSSEENYSRKRRRHSVKGETGHRKRLLQSSCSSTSPSPRKRVSTHSSHYRNHRKSSRRLSRSPSHYSSRSRRRSRSRSRSTSRYSSYSSSSSSSSSYSRRSRSRSYSRSRSRSRSGRYSRSRRRSSTPPRLPYPPQERPEFMSSFLWRSRENNAAASLPYQPTNRQRLDGQPFQERRCVYVGRIEEGTTQSDLRKRFEVFGPINDISMHFRETGDNYGFVKYKSVHSAYKAIEHGNDNPNLPAYNLCFGGRRQFCKAQYSDLDSQQERYEYPPQAMPTRPPPPPAAANRSYDALLQDALRMKQ